MNAHRDRSISSPSGVLKFYYLTFNSFLLVIQAEISFNESSVLTFDLCNIWFVSVGFHCLITIISEVLLTTSFLLSWWQMRWAFESTCIVLAWAFAKDFQCSCLFFHFELCRYAEGSYAECRYAEWRDALKIILSHLKLQPSLSFCSTNRSLY